MPNQCQNVDELFGTISGSKYFSKIDLSKGFWQIELDERSRPYTAFVTSEGLYQFKVMPFGLLTSPASFNRMMRKLLSGMSNVVSFLDDILVHTTTLEEHVTTLRELFERLRNANLTARPSKCEIGCRSLQYLGHTMSNGEIKAKYGQSVSDFGCTKTRH